MPARELGSSLDAQKSAQNVGTTLLKRHKILPHPRENRNSDTASVDSDLASIPTAETSSPRVLKHTSKRRIGASGLPPTPPAHSRQSSETQSVVVPNPKIELTTVNDALSVSTPSTPPIQKSPPTPDVTPPRAMPPLTSRPTNSRYPSSRADSFRTAPETPYASDADDDEASTVRPKLPSARISESGAPQSEERSVKRKEIGLGLGLESDGEGSATPKPKIVSSRDEFVIFDGEWANHSNDDVSEVEREWDDNLMRNVTVRKNRHRDQQDQYDGMQNEVVEADLILPTQATKAVRKLPLHEGVGHRRLKRDITEPTRKSGTWPRMAKEIDSPGMPDTKRFSTMSGRSTTSTVVEAMVVDAPAQRRRTLRHTKKHFGLRDFGSDQSTMSSAPPSEVSSVRRHRLVHRDDRIPERRDQSLASNATMSTTSSKSRRKVIREGGIPVVVIPDRVSSAHNSKPPSLRSTSSRKTKRSMSLQSAPLSHSSKFNEPGYFDIRPATKKRTMSESAGSSNSVRTDYPPSIPTRKSSLSAPTSRNTSRAGSLTAESLRAHNALLEKQMHKPEPVKILRPSTSEKDPEPHSARLNVDHNGDPLVGYRRSTQVTPFSQASYETTGTIGTTAEISQAMAVSLYPHQNKSWRVIHKQLEVEPHIAASKAEPEPQPLALRRLITHQPVVELNGQNMDDPLTPQQPTHNSDGVESPLRNPRAPPEPPAIKFIPPTPSELSPGAYAERQLGFYFNPRLDEDLDDRPSTSDRAKRAFSIRRALGTRRYSEVIIPESRLLKRKFSISGRRKDMSTQTSKPEANPTTHYPSVLDQPADDSKLHPFWKPANFWDDLEDNDSDEEDDFPETYVSSGHRPAAPKRSFSGRLKRTFAILPLSYNNDYYEVPIDRKTMRRSPSGNLRVVKQKSNNTLRREARERQFYEPKEGEFGHGFKEGNRGRIHTIPGLGLRIEYVGLKGLGKKINERRREQRNARLRATISSPRGLRNGVDEVLESKRNVI
ncbi:hypothetical protein ACMFMF_005854 [Clarireedia jacksonii]